MVAFKLLESQSTSNNENDFDISKSTTASAAAAAAAAAAKRKGSFKKWLRSSHRKLTSTTMSSTTGSRGTNQKLLQLSSNSDLDSMKIKVSF